MKITFIRPSAGSGMKLTIIHPCIGRRVGQKYIRTWQMEPLPAATLAGLTSQAASDLVGEKLSEPHVRAVITRLLSTYNLRPAFVLLVPIVAPVPRYCLYLQDRTLAPNAAMLAPFAADLDAGLCQNPHYAHARALGQLSPAHISQFQPSSPDAWQLYEHHCLARGKRAGNLKPVMLDPHPDWPAIFDPHCADHKMANPPVTYTEC